jgi:tetratricopeptide (TPR) repeat protein
VQRGERSDRAPQQGADVDVGAADLARAVGPARAAKVEKRLRSAADAFDNERFGEARSILAPLVDEAPGSAALRELYGLSLYRLGLWKKAASELETFRQITGSTEQNPVLADCYRALKRYGKVDELWEELREASPSGPLVTEGRIVTAGSLADRGRLDEAIALLEQGFKMPKRPKLHHIRRGYALADLKERAGDVPAARGMFERIAAVDPDFADVRSRVRALS